MSIRDYFPCTGGRVARSATRRDFLYGLGASLGGVAFTAMLADEYARGNDSGTSSPRNDPLAVKPQQLPAKAKNCIFLMMEGGPSHIDCFDPKPALERLHLSEFQRSGEQKSAMESGKRYYVRRECKIGRAHV